MRFFSSFHKHNTLGGYPFTCRTTNRCATHVLKHPGYWCYPGVESRSYTGAWAGRCVIAHLDDCWGPSSKVSGIVSPDVAPLTTVKRRLVLSVFELGIQDADASTPASWPCLLVFSSTSDQLISGFDSYMSVVVIFFLTYY
ncbi:uncharacterized protein LACBIDRAFT_314548 [Laccaria bicolor S238N-H82]|uniref:Predicted protein n=1 Tax=Laccaria bicolor (strain S238N-H82 / ATCC MYA-4686) TaxID=486041 RepID=B0DYT0_LACBS|nr:uncharacterized protein LACBIDRAFT_314548 [Laccaria bicolor S238N-H82]EDR00299.1 predicted protein [Laccaria bicolor S238N-H82]|eukprot:XP_001889051.1 predicted protein [Laccaria bicolor S238N-H82]